MDRHLNVLDHKKKQIKIQTILNLVKINHMMNKINKLKLKLVKFHMDGMINLNILVMIINQKKLLNKSLWIKSNNLLKNHKIKIGGELLEINLI